MTTVNNIPKEKYLAWLDSLIVSDVFAIYRRDPYNGSTYDILIVERLTPKQIVTREGRRFKRCNGTEIGGSSLRSIEPVTDEIRARNEAFKLREWFDRIRYKPESISIDQLRASSYAFFMARK